PIVTLTITRAESAPARIPATTIVALTIAPRSPVVGAHLAPPNGLGSPRLAPALLAVRRFPRLFRCCGWPRGRLRRSRHLGRRRGRRGFRRVRLSAGGHARRRGRGVARALRRSDAADRDRSKWRSIDADCPWLARFARNTFAVEIDPGA